MMSASAFRVMVSVTVAHGVIVGTCPMPPQAIATLGIGVALTSFAIHLILMIVTKM
ncbi:hypothetical protein E2C01_072241 [Portunus trituberculatus]|uniref:Uncharacterized protein n=1 Tax=Portunus trituberculatus TaxID=210409 RepID=A0A5B7I776_PORTR|nr:hypothetical protein [Portunus trituberculatus]